MTTEKDKFIVAADLLLLRDNQMLLSRRFNTGYEDGNYHAVGGHVEKKTKLSPKLSSAKQKKKSGSAYKKLI